MSKQGKSIIAGPWGGESGGAWTFVPKGEISNITITYGEAINSIIFKSSDEKGFVETSAQFGTKEGKQKAEIPIDIKVEKLKSISGTVYDAYNTTHIVSSLIFTTTLDKVYGPFGGGKGTAFSLNVNDSHFHGFHGRSGWWLDAIGVNLHLSTSDISKGPYGGKGGGKWSHRPEGQISRVIIFHDNTVVRSIQIESVDDTGEPIKSDKYGNTDEGFRRTVAFTERTGKLIGISGTYGNAYNTILPTSVSFHTDKNHNIYGPFGNESGTKFREVVEDSAVTGFHGTAGTLLDSIGIFREPAKYLNVGLWGGPGGNEWTYAPKEVISQITITHSDIINSITFTSKDDKGFSTLSPDFGSPSGTTTKIVLEDANNEKLNGMSGTFGSAEGSKLVITSLSFTTNKNNMHGPFGKVNGTSFSLPLKNGIITGFKGRCSGALDAIGALIASE